MPTSQDLYWEGMQRGLTGRQLADYAGVPVNEGTSPPVISPEPVQRTEPVERFVVAPRSAANFVRYPEGGASEMDSYWNEFERNFANAPIAEAQKAYQAALQYQSMRQFNRAVAAGVDPAIAAMRFAPGMNRGTLSGIASLSRATAPKEPYEFVPGNVETGQPASWQTPSRTGRPLTISQSAIPKPAQSFGNIVREEITPGSGVYITREEGRPGFKIASLPRQGLTPDQLSKVEIDLKKDISKYQQQLKFINPEDPSYQSTVDLIKTMQDRVSEIRNGTSAAPRVSAPASQAPTGASTATRRFRWNRETQRAEEIK